MKKHDFGRRPWFFVPLSFLLALAIFLNPLLPVLPQALAEIGQEITPLLKDMFPEPEGTPTPEEQAELDKANPYPQIATIVVSPDKNTELKSTSGKIIVNIPAGAVAEEVRVELIDHLPQSSETMGFVSLFELNGYATDRDNASVNKFAENLTITVNHNPEDLAGFETSNMKLLYLDEEAGQWVPVADSSYDTDQYTTISTVDHFTYYGEQPAPIISGPGRIMASQTDLHSGTATYSYPIEIPPGAGGFQPEINLTYNSGVADEMKNKRSVGSWVGTGWTLHLGRINFNVNKNTYSLELNNASCELFKDSNNVYHTVPETYSKLTFSNNIWTMYDSDGVFYQFGGTSDSQQYYCETASYTKIYYRWDLNYVEDTNSGNSITVSYIQDMFTDPHYSGGASVRSAYPQHIYYNNDLVDIQFNSSYDDYDYYSGNLRYDNPKCYGGYYAPKIMENKRLNYIEIYVNSSLVRKYNFSYNTTNTYLSNDYGGIYYAGKHTLTSITEIGADGTSQLPATSFTYTDIQTYLNDYPVTPQYTGNPGNPASFSWPHLYTITNGFGVTVTYSYTQKPALPVSSIWTREVVTGKTTNPGIGPSETYQYTYTGNPHYLSPNSAAYYYAGWPRWDDQYRGFSQVRETDNAGNYTEHYFYTTGTLIDEHLTSKEYKTEYYNSSAQLLEKKEYDWDYTYHNSEHIKLSYQRVISGIPYDIEVTNDRVYVVERTLFNEIMRVHVFDLWMNEILYFGSVGSGNGQFYYPIGVAGDSSGYIYVVDSGNHRIQKFDSSGTYVTQWGSQGSGDGQFNSPSDITIDSDGYVYVCDQSNHRIQKFTDTGTFVTKWGTQGSGDGQFNNPMDVDVDSEGNIYVVDYTNYRIQKFTNTGTFISKHGSQGTGEDQFSGPRKISIDNNDNHYILDYVDRRIQRFGLSGYASWTSPLNNPYSLGVGPRGEFYIGSFSSYGPGYLYLYDGFYSVELASVTTTVGSKVSRTRYLYDDYGNVVTEYRDGDLDTTADNATVWRLYYPNTTDNILSKVARERLYSGTQESDSGGANLKQETLYYYDGNNTSNSTPPTVGNLTRLEQKYDSSNSVSSYFTYDSYGNCLTEQDPNSNTWTTTYETTYHTYPSSIAAPVAGQSESYTFDIGTSNLLTRTDVNGVTTSYVYDTFKRLVKVIKSGDSSDYPTILYEYNNWGTINSQNLKTYSKIANDDYIWQSQYFDGAGRVVQVHSRGETGYTIISATTAYNSRGLVDKQYVSQNIASAQVSDYTTPDAGWKYTSYAYDGLGRVTTLTNADSTMVSHDYSTAWQELVTNARGYKTRYFYDAFRRLIKVEELDASHNVYATTEYSYDVMSNLTQVVDEDDNTTAITYDWLSRKTAMSDPDMGSWSYGYDSNGNLTSQTDAKSQTITLSYDALNRLTGKTYEQGSGMTNVTYTYDSTADGNYGKGLRTGMTDASGSSSYKYDARGRIITETKTIDSTPYTTQYSYYPNDWVNTITYPTGEVVTQGYNDRGFPDTLSGSVVGSLVTSTLYNNLGQVTEINLNNNTSTIFGYYGTGGTYDTTGGYYGRLYQNRTEHTTDWLSGWENRIKITIDESKIDSDLTQFPVLIHLSADSGEDSQDLTDIFAELGANYQKIAVTQGDGETELYVEVEKWDSNNEEAWLWVSKSGWTVSNSEDTVLYLYYDSTHADNTTYVGATNSTPAESVWDSDYVAVYHMSDGADNTHIYDSTSNSYDGTKKGSNEPQEVTGLTGEAQLGDGTDDYIALTNFMTICPTTEITLECLLNLTSTAGDHDLMGHLGTGRVLVHFPWGTSVHWQFGTPYSNIAKTMETSAGVWEHWAFTNSVSGNVMKMFCDGTQWHTGNTSGTFTDVSADFNIFGRSTSPFNGKLDEVRISDAIRSDAWIKATYYTCWDDLLTFSAAETENLINTQYTWDETGNLTQRADVLTPETESFTYDFLDRLTAVSGPYSESYSYDEIGNIVSKNGTSYTYSTKPHAVTAVGATSYTYDGNGNMTARGSQTLTWDVENKVTTVAEGGSSTTFVYDGDGNRIKKTEGGETVLYINQYYEKNLTTGVVTTHYYLGGKEVAFKVGSDLRYPLDDHLLSSVGSVDSSGTVVATVKYYPFGTVRLQEGDLGFDKMFTGQRLDDTGLYYYGARYYDATIGRFISADSMIPDWTNPQSLNRYSYCLNNPLKYTDPSGNQPTPEQCTDTNGWNWGYDTATGIPNIILNPYLALVSSGQMSYEEVMPVDQANGFNIDFGTILTDFGVEDIYNVNTSLGQNMPVIDVQEGSILDKLLFFTDTVTIYPLGVFTNLSMSAATQEEESFHWYDQSNWGPFVPIWYRKYIYEYAVNFVIYGFDSDLAHNAVSFE